MRILKYDYFSIIVILDCKIKNVHYIIEIICYFYLIKLEC